MKQLLEQLGLTSKEADVYLASLHIGTKPASSIAKLVNYPRSTTRVLLMQLHKKGFVNFFTKNNKQYFWPTPPQEVGKLIEKKQKELEKINDEFQSKLPDLENLYQRESHIPKVYYFEGKKGVMRAYNMVLSQDVDEIYAYDLYGKVKSTVLDDFWPEYYKKRKRSKIVLRSLTTFSDENRNVREDDKRYSRETRFLPFYMISHYGEKNIAGNLIINYSLHPDELLATVIESQFLAEMEKTIFKTMWYLAGKLDYNNE